MHQQMRDFLEFADACDIELPAKLLN